ERAQEVDERVDPDRPGADADAVALGRRPGGRQRVAHAGVHTPPRTRRSHAYGYSSFSRAAVAAIPLPPGVARTHTGAQAGSALRSSSSEISGSRLSSPRATKRRPSSSSRPMTMLVSDPSRACLTV